MGTGLLPVLLGDWYSNNHCLIQRTSGVSQNPGCGHIVLRPCFLCVILLFSPFLPCFCFAIASTAFYGFVLGSFSSFTWLGGPVFTCSFSSTFSTIVYFFARVLFLLVWARWWIQLHFLFVWFKHPSMYLYSHFPFRLGSTCMLILTYCAHEIDFVASSEIKVIALLFPCYIHYCCSRCSVRKCTRCLLRCRSISYYCNWKLPSRFLIHVFGSIISNEEIIVVSKEMNVWDLHWRFGLSSKRAESWTVISYMFFQSNEYRFNDYFELMFARCTQIHTNRLAMTEPSAGNAT